MRTIELSRRAALKLLLVGSATSLATGCGLVDSLPSGRAVSRTDGKELSNSVRAALRNNPQTATVVLEISTFEDEVTLKGFSSSQTTIDTVERVANRVDGVRIVLMDVYLN